MIFDAKHEMIRKLVRQFSETELTTEVLDKVEATGEFPEEIVDKMERDELDIDQLSEQLKRAKVLVKLCKDKLTKTDEEIKKLLSEE